MKPANETTKQRNNETTKLHIFNPENDMALASGSPGYTPPANIRAYRREHRFLPLQWAQPGDVVWDGEENLAHLFLDEASAPEICPWGWSPALVHELSQAGVPAHHLPDREWLARLRRLSGRESTVPVQREWGLDAVVCRTLDEVQHYVGQWGRVIMKSPWSSSGKGLMQTDNPNWQGWVARILRLQGAVVVERLVERRLDFAMEFRMIDAEYAGMDNAVANIKPAVAEYVGLNVFRTDDHGHFVDNIRPCEQDNASFVSSLLRNPASLSEVREWYLEHLPRLAPWYRGPVGVDMMVLADGTLHPCVEINWRMTMGMVAVLADRGQTLP